MNLLMIRHGQSYVNLTDWEGGNTDEGLTPKGTKQAAALAKWLPQKLPKIDMMYCSSMQRARETAAPLAKAYKITPQYDDRLREVGNNKLDHTAWPSDNLPEYSDFWGSERPFSSITPDYEGGESLMHFRIRVGNFIEELIDKHRAETIVVVCHGGVIEVTFDHINNTGPWRRCEVWTHNTGITRIELVEHPTRETWRLHYHSRIEHLRSL
ncbi:MAG: histidine phosphatase family protein [Anaerolineales bacterium]|nr:histidine phosphatase family protein [Anaerolineales bacterium]